MANAALSSAEVLRYEAMTESNRSEVIDFLLKHFVTGESMQVSIEATSKDAEPLMQRCFDEGLKHPGLSLLVYNSRDELICSRLLNIVDLDERRKAGGTLSETPESNYLEAFTEKTWKVANFLQRMESGVPEMVPLNECKLALKFVLLCVRPDYQTKAVGHETSLMGCKEGKHRGCTYAIAQATTLKHQYWLGNTWPDWRALKVVKHADYLDKHGQRIFHCKAGTERGVTMILKL